MHRDLRSGPFNLTEIVGGQLDGNGSDVLLQAVPLRGSWDWNNPWLLRKEPRERDLGRCRPPPLRGPGKEINQGLIGLSILRRKARDDVAEVRAVERRILVDLPREEAFPERAEWHEADSEFLEGRQ